MTHSPVNQMSCRPSASKVPRRRNGFDLLGPVNAAEGSLGLMTQVSLVGYRGDTIASMLYFAFKWEV